MRRPNQRLGSGPHPFSEGERGRRGAQSCPSKRYKPILARFLDAEPKAAPPDYSRSRLSLSVKSPRATLRTGVLMPTPELMWCRYRELRCDAFADNAFLVFL